MRAPRDYDDIPGTYVQDAAHLRKGHHLNMFCLSLSRAGNRDAFRAGEAAYLDRFPMTQAQRKAVLARDWLGLPRLRRGRSASPPPACFPAPSPAPSRECRTATRSSCRWSTRRARPA